MPQLVSAPRASSTSLPERRENLFIRKNYFPVPNSLLDDLAEADFSIHENSAFLAIYRDTQGFNRNWARILLETLAFRSRMDIDTLLATLQSLAARKVITIADTNRKGTLYYLELDSWSSQLPQCLEPKQPATPQKPTHSRKTRSRVTQQAAQEVASPSSIDCQAPSPNPIPCTQSALSGPIQELSSVPEKAEPSEFSLLLESARIACSAARSSPLAALQTDSEWNSEVPSIHPQPAQAPPQSPQPASFASPSSALNLSSTEPELPAVPPQPVSPVPLASSSTACPSWMEQGLLAVPPGSASPISISPPSVATGPSSTEQEPFPVPSQPASAIPSDPPSRDRTSNTRPPARVCTNTVLQTERQTANTHTARVLVDHGDYASYTMDSPIRALPESALQSFYDAFPATDVLRALLSVSYAYRGRPEEVRNPAALTRKFLEKLPSWNPLTDREILTWAHNQAYLLDRHLRKDEDGQNWTPQHRAESRAFCTWLDVHNKKASIEELWLTYESLCPSFRSEAGSLFWLLALPKP